MVFFNKLIFRVIYFYLLKNRVGINIFFDVVYIRIWLMIKGKIFFYGWIIYYK